MIDEAEIPKSEIDQIKPRQEEKVNFKKSSANSRKTSK